MVACMNHSCHPNVLYEWARPDGLVHVVATRPMAAGDELCLSYLRCTPPSPLLCAP